MNLLCEELKQLRRCKSELQRLVDNAVSNRWDYYGEHRGKEITISERKLRDLYVLVYGREPPTCW